MSERLDSWKDIAAYLKRDVSTVQRWEKREGMPVHRHVHDKIGSVYAFPTELDAWARSRRAAVREEPALAPAAEPKRWWLSAILAIAVVAAVVITFRPRGSGPANPLASARFTPLTDFEGIEEAATISRDGRFVAFLSDRAGPTDVWLTQIGSGRFINLTSGTLRELVNPDIRLLGFSPDGALVTVWVRRQRPDGRPDISVWAIPTLGGEPKLYLEGAAELDWSPDGQRIAYHTPASGDPIFVRERNGSDRRIFIASSGHHNHYPLWSPSGDAIYFVSGVPPNELDVWRIDANGGKAEQLTSHHARVVHPAFLDARTLLYLATDAEGNGPWLYALDIPSRATRRVSFGVERYTSLASDTAGKRLVVTVANRRRTFWRVPLGDTAAGESEVSQIAVPIVGARSVRSGPGYLIYVSSRGDSESIWKLVGTNASELWSGPRITGGPSVSRDGRRIAFSTESRIIVMNADGSEVRMTADTLQPRGAPAWSPDGKELVVPSGGRLAKVTISDLHITPLGTEFAADPLWSADGRTIFYTAAEVGTTFPLRAMAADGSAPPVTRTTLSRGARHIASLDGSIVILRGDISDKNLWAVDVSTGRERQLTNFPAGTAIRDFDVSADGHELVFDREQETADVVLVDR